MLDKQILTPDLCVVGGGLAGICAAVAAARGGAKVVLMHERPVLGGNASSEIRVWISGALGPNNRETGIIEEIELENFRRNPTKNYFLWDTVLYEFVSREKNIQLLLNCTCMDASTEEGSFPYGRDRRITSVTGYQMTTQRFFEVRADHYADCSGDSILAPLTGALYREGREGRDEFGEPTHVQVHDDLHMGMSCLIQGRETERRIPFTAPDWCMKLDEEDFDHCNPNVYTESENYWYLELGGDRDGIRDTEEVGRELVSLALGAWDHIKNSGHHNADNWELDFLGFLPGKRESRRMVGEYTITAHDVLNNTPFEDAVAYGGWPIDDHYPAGFFHKGCPNTNICPEAPYSIPYRSLYSANVSNLFFAGRNISMTHMAMSSIRVMATCALLGQAVGAAAALCTKRRVTPHDVFLSHLNELQDDLQAADAFLPAKPRRVSPLCAATPIVGADGLPIPGQEALKDGCDRPHASFGNRACGLSLPNGDPLEYRFDTPQAIHAVHVTFNSDLNRETLPGGPVERGRSMRANVRLSSPLMHMPKPLCRAFVLEIIGENGLIFRKDITDNPRRAYHIPVDRKDVAAIRLTPLGNWGGAEKTDVFSFDFT